MVAMGFKYCDWQWSIGPAESSPPPAAAPRNLSYEVQTSDTYALPLDASGTYNMLVDWGDNSSDTITAWDQAEATHTYGSPGTYTVTITGTCTHHAFGNGGDAAKIRTVANCQADGLVSIDWYGCTGLTEFESGCRISATVVDLEDFGRGCTSLTSINRELFYNSGNADHFRNCFLDCTSLAEIPQGLLKYCAAAVNMHGMFFNCPITSIPEDLFANCPVANRFESTFRGTAITSIPAGLFAHNPETFNFVATFLGCTSLTAVPSGLFDNCPLVEFFDGLFDGCNNAALTTIPTDLFNNCPIVTKYAGTWQNTRLTAATVDQLLINIQGTNTAEGTRTIDYSPMTGDAHLDSNRSTEGLAAIQAMITDGWTREGTY